MEIKFEDIKNLMESKKYIATDEIVWNVIKGIKKMKNGKQIGQDLYSICLEGPPGAGKSFYAKTYKKVLEEVFNDKVKFLEYQCDSSTGKSDLFEEIRVAAAIANNPDEVIISGMLVEAIDEVNTGKKVILLLDEFEKSRKETDAFMYQFLQDGKIKTTQRGIVEIKQEYKKNLQVILCKNDERELADPLLRRNHIIRLEVMTPENFYKTLNLNLVDYDEDIKNIVSLLYQKMYDQRDDFAKFPSCSEGMQAVEDACDLLAENAPAEVIYADILSNLLKHPDDIESFKIMFNKDEKLKNFIMELQKIKENQENVSLRDEIYKSFFSKEIQEISGMKARYEKNEKFFEKRIQRLNDEIGELKDKIKENNYKNNNTPSKQENAKNNCQEVNETSIAEIRKIAKDIEEISPEGENVYVPINIVNRDGSIFDGNENWYEIYQFEVEEEGWKALEELIKNGYDEFIDCSLKKMGRTKEDVIKSFDYTWIKLMITDRNNYVKNYFKNVICYDGLILMDGADSYRDIFYDDEDKKIDYKVVAKKQIINRKKCI